MHELQGKDAAPDRAIARNGQSLQSQRRKSQSYAPSPTEIIVHFPIYLSGITLHGKGSLQL